MCKAFVNYKISNTFKGRQLSKAFFTHYPLKLNIFKIYPFGNKSTKKLEVFTTCIKKLKNIVQKLKKKLNESSGC